jgi:CRP/FNR family cyclic AMP-dependent transcriptional regulator
VEVAGFFGSAKKVVQVPRGTEVFHEGETGECMYGIVEGTVDLRTVTHLIASLSVDDFFGEMAVVDRSPRMATAVATSDAVLAEIDRNTFLFLVHETPTFALSVMSAMADRLRTLHAATPADWA